MLRFFFSLNDVAHRVVHYCYKEQQDTSIFECIPAIFFLQIYSHMDAKCKKNGKNIHCTSTKCLLCIFTASFSRYIQSISWEKMTGERIFE